MATVTFTNNLGTIAFERAMVSIADEWQWDGVRVRYQKRVSVNAHVQRNVLNPESVDTIQTNATTARGEPGTLTLPWATLTHMSLVRMDMPGEVWIDMIPVVADFVDEEATRNEYSIDFFNLTLHRANITLGLPAREIVDEFVQMPISGLPSMPTLTFDPRWGPIRTISMYDNMTVNLHGFYMVPADMDLGLVLKTLSQRGGSHATIPITDLPAGYPRVFDMSDISAAVAAQFPIRKLWVRDSQFVWDVANNIAEVDIMMECPPQKLGVS